MRRDLHQVLLELHDGLCTSVASNLVGVHVNQAEVSLPVDVSFTLKNGACVFQADVMRQRLDADWIEKPSQLRLQWHWLPTEEMPT